MSYRRRYRYRPPPPLTGQELLAAWEGIWPLWRMMGPRVRLCLGPKTPPELLGFLVSHFQGHVARHPNTPPTVLRYLAQMGYLREVQENPALPLLLLENPALLEPDPDELPF
jgi:hypothetical protein